MRTFGALYDIISFHLGLAVTLVVAWVMIITGFGLKHWVIATLVMGFAWLLTPFIVVLARPVENLAIAAAARDPEWKTWVEGPEKLVRGMWGIGLIYTLLLTLFHWERHPIELIVLLLCIFAISVITSEQLFGSWSTRVSKIVGFVILGCLLMAFRKGDLVGDGKPTIDPTDTGAPLSNIGNNWVPDPHSVHKFGAGGKEYTRIAPGSSPAPVLAERPEPPMCWVYKIPSVGQDFHATLDTTDDDSVNFKFMDKLHGMPREANLRWPTLGIL